MPTPPLPDVPCVRVRASGNIGEPGEWGSRFFLSYSGSAPTGANCITLAGDVAGAWAEWFGVLYDSDWTLNEVDVIDIATDSGLSGQWTGSDAGTRSGSSLPAQCATNIEFGIARRYRGGKPRMYLPPGCNSDLLTQASYTSAFVTAASAGAVSFFSYLEGLSIGSMGTLKHVNLSYYKGFENFTTPSGRERAVPSYRATALHDNVTGYSAKQVIGSQKRRRTSTTP